MGIALGLEAHVVLQRQPVQEYQFDFQLLCF